MSNTFTLDGREIPFEPGQTVMQAALAAGVFVPHLCYHPEFRPHGSCKLCTMKVNGRPATSCTLPATAGMQVESDTPEINDKRRMLIQMLLVEGNHFCPSCEKSGNCELQALGYRYRLTAPRFPYLWPGREVDAAAPFLMLEHNRCVQCRRCVQAVQAKDGRKIFAAVERGGRVSIEIDGPLAAKMTEAEARAAMDLCPVGAIIKKRTGFAVPIGKRKYDHEPIGSEVGKGTGR